MGFEPNILRFQRFPRVCSVRKRVACLNQCVYDNANMRSSPYGPDEK